VGRVNGHAFSLERFDEYGAGVIRRLDDPKRLDERE
jgi:hypothetical protein